MHWSRCDWRVLPNLPADHYSQLVQVWSSVKKGADIEVLKRDLEKLLGVAVHVNIEEIRKPELDAQLIADGIAQQFEKTRTISPCYETYMQNVNACWRKRHQNHDFWSFECR